MDPKQLEIIQQKTEKLVKYMNVDKVIKFVQEKQIINEAKLQTLQPFNNKHVKARTLLQLLPQLGKYAFSTFRSALIKSGNTQLALSLQDKNVDTANALLKSVNTSLENQSEATANDPIVINDSDVVWEASPLETPTVSNNDERCMIHLANDCFLTAKTYKGVLQIHIRQYKRNGNTLYPTKQGVVLYLSRWLMLESLSDKLDHHLSDSVNDNLPSEQKYHLGGGVFATVNSAYPLINIRHYWLPDDAIEPCPTKRGVALTKSKGGQLQNIMTVIRDYVPELQSAEICEFTHYGQMSLLKCGECSYFNKHDNEGETSTGLSNQDIDDNFQNENDTMNIYDIIDEWNVEQYS